MKEYSVIVSNELWTEVIEYLKFLRQSEDCDSPLTEEETVLIRLKYDVLEVCKY